MDAKHFLAEFRHIVNAPGGGQWMRELVLQLAVSGELIDPKKDGSTAKEAIQKAFRLRTKYETSYELRRSLPLSPVRSYETPYGLPNHWAWERLGNIACYVQRGKGPKYDDISKCLVVSQKCVQWNGINLSLARGLDTDFLEKYGRERFLQPNDLLLNSTGTGTVGRSCIYSNDGNTIAVADSHVTVIRLSNFESRYIWCVLKSPGVLTRIDPTHENSLVSGTTNQVELSTSAVKNLLIPCPPLQEQKRIVAKVDKLMALCDKLEAQQQKRHKLQARTRTTALEALGNAQTSHELKTAWERVAVHLPLLLDEPEDVGSIRQAIRTFALRGHIFCGTEERVSSSLKATIDKAKDPISKSEVDWEIPHNWVWSRFGWLGESRLGKMLDKAKNSGSPVPYLRNINVRWRFFDLSNILEMKVEERELEKISAKQGDLIICEGGEPGRAAIWNYETSIVIQKALHRYRCGEDLIPEYALLCLEADFTSGRLYKYYTGATIKHLTGKSLYRYVIPLPPIEDQHKIINRYSEFSKVCDLLESQLKKWRKTAEKLAQAAVAAVIGTQIKDKETMKAPKTELVTQLKLTVSPKKKDQAPLSAILAKHNGELSAKGLWNYSGLDIDGFYRQLKTEMSHGWIEEPQKARVIEKAAASDKAEAF